RNQSRNARIKRPEKVFGACGKKRFPRTIEFNVSVVEEVTTSVFGVIRALPFRKTCFSEI
ncbi:hypothetical protein, partial [Actibacterium mucosum]|uniref:hypothetical protein n=1 Tax=Actibacterium mucosum TaxID=1087332 RepID=UPI001F315FC2